MVLVKSIEIDIGVRGDTDSKAKLDAIDKKAADLKAAFPTYGLKIDSAAATEKLAIFRGELKDVAKTWTAKVEVDTSALGKLRSAAGKLPGIGGLFGGGSGGASGAADAASGSASGAGAVVPAGLPLIGALGPVGGTAAVVAGLAALPLAAQAAAGGITFALGGALAGIAILGASKSKSVVTSFDALKTHASKDLTDIGVSFVPVVNSILGTATSVLGKLTPVFSGAEKVIAGPFKVFGDTLIESFGSPAVKKSIGDVATAFGAILKSVTPGLATDVGQVATGVSKLAGAVAANPKAFSDFVGFLAATAGGALTAIASLARFASYVEVHFIPVFDGARHEISHVWADIASNTNDVWKRIWADTIGRAIQGAHDLEDWYNNGRHGIAVALDLVRTGSITAWNTIWANTISRVSNGITDAVSWFRDLPGKAQAALGNAGTTLRGWGGGVISGLLSGMTSVIGTVWNFIKGIPGKILSFLGIHSPPQWAIDAGKHIMNGLGIGMRQAQTAGQKALAGYRQSVAAGGGGGNGPVSAGAAAAQNYARSRLAGLGWSQYMGDLIRLWNQESGWNRLAYNASSGATGIPQSLPYTKMPRAAWLPSQGGQASAGAQIDWGLSYIAAAYGNPAQAWAHETAFNWYDTGYGVLPRGLSLSLNTTGHPEMLQPARRGRGGGDTYNAYITINAPVGSHPADIGRELSRYLGEFIKRGGRLYPAGATPR